MTNAAHKRAARAHQRETGVPYARALRDVAHRRRLAVPLGVDQGSTVTLDLTDVAHGGPGPHAAVLGDTNRTRVSELAEKFSRLPDVCVWSDGEVPAGSAVRHVPAEQWAAAVDDLTAGRMTELRAADARDVHEHPMPDVVAIVDAALDEKRLTQLGRVGRSLGIHVICVAENDDALPAGFRSNLSTTIRVAGDVATVTWSDAQATVAWA